MLAWQARDEASDARNRQAIAWHGGRVTGE